MSDLEATAREAQRKYDKWLEMCKADIWRDENGDIEAILLGAQARFGASFWQDVPVLYSGVLELLEERERLREEESTCQAMYADATEHITRLAAENARLREVAKASKRVLLADASGRKPDVREWQRLADALEALAPKGEGEG